MALRRLALAPAPINLNVEPGQPRPIPAPARYLTSPAPGLDRHHHLLAAALDAVSEMVVLLHPDGRIARINRACEALTGMTNQEAAGHRLVDLFLVEDGADALEALASGAARNTAVCETACRTPDGFRRIAWRMKPIAFVDGAVQYFVATGQDVTEQRRLQAAILDTTDREQRRIGRDLHDGLGSHLTGIAFMGRALEQKLVDRGVDEAADVDRLVSLVNEGIDKMRGLARGLLSAAVDERGLATALAQIAADVERMFGISCRLECAGQVVLDDPKAAAHLCHIAREALHNAVRHGGARRAVLRLSADGRQGMLTIRDNGRGFTAAPDESGMGLRIMRCRAAMMGGSLQIDRAEGGPTAVICRFPVRPAVTSPLELQLEPAE